MRRAGMLPVVACLLSGLGLVGCDDGLPSGLADTWEYRAVFETTPVEETVRGRVRFARQEGDSLVGTFRDLAPDRDDAAQFGTDFPLSGTLRGDAVAFRISAPGVRIDHDGIRNEGTISGTCSAGVLDQPEDFPCTFTMTAR